MITGFSIDEVPVTLELKYTCSVNEIFLRCKKNKDDSNNMTIIFHSQMTFLSG